MERWVMLRKGADFAGIGKISDQSQARLPDQKPGCCGRRSNRTVSERDDRRPVRRDADEGYGQGCGNPERKLEEGRDSGSLEIMILMESMPPIFYWKV